MRITLQALLAGVLLMGPAVRPAEAITIRDLIALAQAGLGDDVLVALIEADQSVFELSAMDVIDLSRRGLSDRVLVKMVQTGKPQPSALASTPDLQSIPNPLSFPDPQSPILNPQSPIPNPQSTPPQVVVHQTVVQHVEVQESRSRVEYVPVVQYVPVAVLPVREERAPEPVYWGFGGQRRPDSWAETKAPVKEPVKEPAKIIKNR